jgi:ribosomal protein S18 acetylase RimI-like enzyme
MNLIVDVQHAEDAEVEAHIAKAIRLHKHQSAPDYFLEDGSPIDWQPVTITMRDAEGNLIGSLIGSSMFGGMHIHWLWVEEAHRHQGHARELLNRAITIGKQRGCTFAWLDTWSAQGAYTLYEKLGAKVIMRIDDFPLGSSLLRYRLDFA